MPQVFFCRLITPFHFNKVTNRLESNIGDPQGGNKIY